MSRHPLLWLALVAVLGAGVIVWRSFGDVVETEAQDAQLRALAAPVAAVCQTDPGVRARLGDATCETARVAVEPVPGEDGADGDAGADGADGAPGRGIVATLIRADGHLAVTYSDGSVMDAGPVAGKPGVMGRGIELAEVVDGRLVVTYTDDVVEDLGQVVGARGAAGPAGRGVDAVTVVDGRLVVRFTDGVTEDAGELPAGPPGAPGQLPGSYTRVFADETSEVCTRAGGDEDAPVWSCTDRE